MSGGLFTVTTPNDIDSALLRTDAAAEAIDQTFASCPNLDSHTRDTWGAYYQAYKTFSTSNKNHWFFALGLPEIWDQIVAYEHELGDWQGIASKQCGGDGPTLVAHDTVNPAGFGIDTGTKALIGIGLVTLAVIVLKK